MKFFHQVFRFYIYSSIHVALATCALVICTYLEFQIPIQYAVLYVTFGMTLVAYNLMKYAQFSVRYHIPASTSMKAIQLLTFASGSMALYFLFYLPSSILWILLPLGLVSVAYMLPILAHKKSLRHIPGLKVFIIATVWTGITVLLPVMSGTISSYGKVGILSVQRFLFIIIVMLPFEIRDLVYDAPSLQTIPQYLGIRKTKRLGLVLLLPFLILPWVHFPLHFPSIIATGITAGITGFFLWKTKRIQHPYYCSFGVESIAIVWAILLGIFTHAFY